MNLIPYLYNDLNLNPAPTVPKRNVCFKCASTMPKLTFLSSVLRLCPNCAPTMLQLCMCPNCFCLWCASTVPQVILCRNCAPTVPESFQFCAPTVPQLCPNWALLDYQVANLFARMVQKIIAQVISLPCAYHANLNVRSNPHGPIQLSLFEQLP